MITSLLISAPAASRSAHTRVSPDCLPRLPEEPSGSCAPPSARSLIGGLASVNSCYLGPRCQHQFLVGVGVAGEAPPSVGRFGQKPPCPADRGGVASGVSC